MSGATTPLPKTMSSRLLTMKFMQRAAATSSPVSASPSTPDISSPKRRKTENGSTPTKFDVDALADQRAIQAAVASEEAKRQIALEKQAKEAGDTRWVLSFDGNHIAASPNLAIRVVETGFANLDSSSTSTTRITYDQGEEEEDRLVMVGRRSFGKFNRVVEKQQDPALSDISSSDAEDEEDENAQFAVPDDVLDSDDPASELIKASRLEALARAKAQRKAKKKSDKAAFEQIAKERKKKEVNLNGMTSLSGRQEPPANNGMKCYHCDGPHMRADCPQLNKRRFDGGGRDEGPKRKIRRANK